MVALSVAVSVLKRADGKVECSVVRRAYESVDYSVDMKAKN